MEAEGFNSLTARQQEEKLDQMRRSKVFLRANKLATTGNFDDYQESYEKESSRWKNYQIDFINAAGDETEWTSFDEYGNAYHTQGDRIYRSEK